MACSILLRRTAALHCALVSALCFPALPAHADSVKILYNFSATEGGIHPGGLEEGPDGRLYGSTNGGGPTQDGTLYSIQPDGTDFRTAFIFDRAIYGRGPSLKHIGADGRIYGTLVDGPPPNPAPGAIFSVRRDGSDFKYVWILDSRQGEDPSGLIEHSGRFYGTTLSGGSDPAAGIPGGAGTLYTVRPDGSEFRVLRVFDSARDGGSPRDDVAIAADGRLYGTTRSGGMHDAGTLYSLKPDGSDFVVHRHFGPAGKLCDETSPLVASRDGFLYGVRGPLLVRLAPGTLDAVTVLDVRTVPDEWTLSDSGLIEGIDGRLYGTMSGFEKSGLFSINRDGSGFLVLRAFDAQDESNPRVGVAHLLQASTGRIFVTSGGGEYWLGALTGVNPDGSDLKRLYDFGGADTGGHEPVAGVVYARDHRLYGLARRGGRQSSPLSDETQGTLYSLKPNGEDFRVHHFFEQHVLGKEDSGITPHVALLRGSNGWLYGSTPYGGEHGYGTIFSVTPGRGKLIVLHHFTIEEGYEVSAPLVEGPGGMLFGVARRGGLVEYRDPSSPSSGGIGTIFSLHRTGKDFKRLHAMDRSPVIEGDHPEAIVLTRQGRLLVSTSAGGEAPDVGTAVLLDRDGATFEIIQRFRPGIVAAPQTLTRPAGSWILGTSPEAVVGTDPGDLRFSPFGGIRAQFSPKPQTVPASSQLFQASDGRLYGATGAPHGAQGEGTLYSVDLATRTYHVHHHFGGDTAGLAPRARFTEGPDGTLYGTGLSGLYGEGAVFAFIRDLQILAGPEDATFVRNTRAELLVLASGPGPLYYHWYRNGKLIHRSSNNTLDLGRVKPGEAGNYHVLVRNRFGFVTSRTATVVVK